MVPSPSSLETTPPAVDAARGNRDAMLAALGHLDELLEAARGGGGAASVARHRGRGKLLARERIELLLDRDAPFLELMPFLAAESEYHVGASVVSGVGVVADVACVIIAHDPTVRGGATNPYALRKVLRSLEIATENRLPVVNLVESAGADLPRQAEIFVPGGQIFRDLSRLSAAGVSTIAVVFGNATAGGAYVPGMCDYSVFVEGGAKVFLGGPPLVKMATGEDSSDEELGGAAMHARVSGLADHLAADERDAIRIARSIVANLNRPAMRDPSAAPVEPPAHDPEGLLDIPSADPRVSFDPRDILDRVLDGSRFDEFKPAYGTALATGWGAIHGHAIGILANAHGVLFSEDAQKAAQFIQLANQSGTPLLFLHNTTGFMVGREFEQRGIIKDGAKMINAVSNSRVPHLGVIVGASYGAANYAMAGRAYKPRFLFSWPNAQVAVMGPQQLAGVLSIVARQAAAARGEDFDEDADAERRQAITEQIEAERTALANSSRGYDDGIIDPRDTRTALGMALAVIDRQPPVADGRFGVFRM